jgi:hypothetical protein
MHSIEPSVPTEETIEHAHYYLTESDEMWCSGDEELFEDILIEIYDHFYEELGHEPDWGTTRAVFFGDGYVIKVPVNSEGVRGNFVELHWYHEYITKRDTTIHPAQCWMHPLSEHYRIPIVCMVEVEVPEKPMDLPKWCYTIDNAQVGFDQSGNLVAYDYGG